MPIVTRLSSNSPADGNRAVTWVDIDTSNDEDRDWLASLEDISVHAKQCLLDPTRVIRRERLEDGLFVSLQTSNVSAPVDTDNLVSLRLLLGKDRVITVRSDTVMAIDDAHAHLESGHILSTALDLFAFVSACLAERLEGIIVDISHDTDGLEDQLLDEDALPTVEALNELRRRIYRTRRLLASMKQVLGLVASDPAVDVDQDDRDALIRSSDHVTSHLENLEDCRARAKLLQDQFEVQISAKMARSSYNLTIVATVFLPLTFITGLLGMNVAGIPESHDPWGFWAVCSVLTVIAVAGWFMLHWRMRD